MLSLLKSLIPARLLGKDDADPATLIANVVESLTPGGGIDPPPHSRLGLGRPRRARRRPFRRPRAAPALQIQPPHPLRLLRPLRRRRPRSRIRRRHLDSQVRSISCRSERFSCASFIIASSFTIEADGDRNHPRTPFPRPGLPVRRHGPRALRPLPRRQSRLRRGRRSPRLPLVRHHLQRPSRNAPADRAHPARHPHRLRRGLARLSELLPDLKPAYAAGHSLGEYSAHVAAGTLTFADAVRTVRLRGQYMQAAVPAGEGAMAAILGLPETEVNDLCAQASDESAAPPPVDTTPSESDAPRADCRPLHRLARQPQLARPGRHFRLGRSPSIAPSSS